MMKLTLRYLIMFSTFGYLIFPAYGTDGNDWPRFRGAKYDGITRENDWQSQWPEAGPKKLWEAKIGIGFASFAVVNHRLFAAGHEGEQDVISCLDAATGKEIWKHTYACKLVANLHEGGPAATPTVAGGRVYTVSKEGHIFCLNADNGTVVWKQELQPLLDLKMPEWGFSGSVLILNDLAIIEAGYLTALNAKTGEVVWKSEKYRPGYGSPVPCLLAGQSCVATLNNDVLLVVKAADGSEVAKTKWETNYATNACTPLVDGNSIFVSTGYGRGCALFQFEQGNLNKVWENKALRSHMANAVLTDGYLYGIDGNSNEQARCQLVCVKMENGETAWKEKGFGCGTVLLAGSKLVILSDEGELSVAAASPTEFKSLAKATVLSGKCWTVPVLVDGRIYCRNAAGDVVCLDVRK